jgi:hypothetical protein
VAHVVQETLDEIVRHRSLKVPEPHLNLPGLREDMRNPGLPNVAILGRHIQGPAAQRRAIALAPGAIV